MVRPQVELLAVEVRPEMLNPFDHGQQLSPSHTVISFRWGEGLAIVPYNTFFSVLDLGEHGTYSVFTGIRVQEVRQPWVGVTQHWCCNQTSL